MKMIPLRLIVSLDFWQILLEREKKKRANVSFKKLHAKHSSFRLQFRLLWTAERFALKTQLFLMSGKIVKLA